VTKEQFISALQEGKTFKSVESRFSFGIKQEGTGVYKFLYLSGTTPELLCDTYVRDVIFGEVVEVKPPVKIAGHTAIKLPGGSVRIGCTEVTKEEVEKVLAMF
jgi:hypothetical protein